VFPRPKCTWPPEMRISSIGSETSWSWRCCPQGTQSSGPEPPPRMRASSIGWTHTASRRDPRQDTVSLVGWTDCQPGIKMDFKREICKGLDYKQQVILGRAVALRGTCEAASLHTWIWRTQYCCCKAYRSPARSSVTVRQNVGLPRELPTWGI